MTFAEFFQKNLTLSIFISFLFFRLFNVIYEDIIAPVLLGIIDSDESIRNKHYKIGNNYIKYGKSLMYLVNTILLLYIIYLLS